MLLVLLAHYIATREYPTVDGLKHKILATFCTIELHSISIVCVNCFVLISGYFGIRLSIKSLSNYLYQILFWSAISVLTATFIGLNHDITLFFQGITWGWFPWAYLILMILSPMLNVFIERSTVRELGRYVILFYLFSTVGGYFLSCRDFMNGMSGLSLVGIYLTGAYLRRSKIKIFNWSPKVDLSVYLIFGLGLLCLNSTLLMMGITSSPYGYLNPVVILMAVYLFLFFNKINIGCVSWINYIATSAFAVYLFHCHPAIGNWISAGWEQINLAFGPFLSIPMAFVSFVCIFIFCILVDRIRIISFRIISCKLGLKQ